MRPDKNLRIQKEIIIATEKRDKQLLRQVL